MSNKWDPTGISLNPEGFKDGLEKLYKRERFYKKHFYKILIGTLILSVVISVLLALGEGYSGVFEMVFIALIAPIIAFIFFIGSLRSLKKGVMKAKLAAENGWVFEPNKNFEIYSVYLEKFPKLFNLGNCYKSLKNVIWGETKQGVPFVVGDFKYSVRRRTNKGSNTTNYTDHFFAIKLNAPLKTNFFLGPKNALSKLTNLFSKKDIQTESIDFNERFYFCYENNGSETQVDIMSVLSPSILEELAKFGGKKKRRFKSLSGGVKVYFQGQSIVFLAPGAFFEKTGVSLSPKSLDITQEDRDELDRQVSYYFDLGNSIYKNIN